MFQSQYKILNSFWEFLSCNKSPILVLGKTPKGYIFGGYTTVLTNFNESCYLEDDKAFVFSLNQKKIFLQPKKKQ